MAPRNDSVSSLAADLLHVLATASVVVHIVLCVYTLMQYFQHRMLILPIQLLLVAIDWIALIYYFNCCDEYLIKIGRQPAQYSTSQSQFSQSPFPEDSSEDSFWQSWQSWVKRNPVKLALSASVITGQLIRFIPLLFLMRDPRKTYLYSLDPSQDIGLTLTTIGIGILLIVSVFQVVFLLLERQRAKEVLQNGVALHSTTDTIERLPKEKQWIDTTERFLETLSPGRLLPRSLFTVSLLTIALRLILWLATMKFAIQHTTFYMQGNYMVPDMILFILSIALSHLYLYLVGQEHLYATTIRFMRGSLTDSLVALFFIASLILRDAAIAIPGLPEDNTTTHIIACTIATLLIAAGAALQAIVLNKGRLQAKAEEARQINNH